MSRVSDFPGLAWLSGFLGAALVACATGSSVGGESHFFCTVDADCPASTPACVARSCRPAAMLAVQGSAGGAADDAGPSVASGGNGGASATASELVRGGAPSGGARAASPDASTRSRDAGAERPAADAACVVQPDGPPWPEPPNYECLQLDNLVLEHPVVVDDGRDGVLSPGEGATFDVTLREINGIGANLYPATLFSVSTDAGVTIGAGDYRYAVTACSVVPVQTRLVISADVALHSTFTVRARISDISGQCTNGHAVDVPISVGDPLP